MTSTTSRAAAGATAVLMFGLVAGVLGRTAVLLLPATVGGPVRATDR